MKDKTFISLCIVEELDEAIVDIEVGGDGRLPITKKAEHDE